MHLLCRGFGIWCLLASGCVKQVEAIPTLWEGCSAGCPATANDAVGAGVRELARAVHRADRVKFQWRHLSLLGLAGVKIAVKEFDAEPLTGIRAASEGLPSAVKEVQKLAIARIRIMMGGSRYL